MANCSDYISADDLKTGKQAVQHIEHVAKSKDANGANALTVTDTIRGEQVTNLTLDGMEAQFQDAQADKEARFQQFLLNSGYQFLGDYENGPYTISAHNQIIRYQNEFWRLNAATNPPYTTTGINSASWTTDVTHLVSVGDANLRQDLSSETGAMKVYRNASPLARIIRSSIFEYLTEADQQALLTIPGVNVIADYALKKAIADGVMVLDIPWNVGALNFGLDPAMLPLGFQFIGWGCRRPYTIAGDSSFINCGVVIRVAAGASFPFYSTGRHVFRDIVFDGRDKTTYLFYSPSTATQFNGTRLEGCGFYRFAIGIGWASGGTARYIGTMKAYFCSISGNGDGVRNLIDSMMFGCTINANDRGVALTGGANNNFFGGCRNEWNTGDNWYAFQSVENQIFGELCDRAGRGGVVAGAKSSWILNGVNVRRSGANQPVGNDYSANFIIIDDGKIELSGVRTGVGANDSGDGGTISPSYNVSALGSGGGTLQVSGSDMTGFVTSAINQKATTLNKSITGNLGMDDDVNIGMTQVVKGRRIIGSQSSGTLAGSVGATLSLTKTNISQNAYDTYVTRAILVECRIGSSALGDDIKIPVRIRREGSYYLDVITAGIVASSGRIGISGTGVTVALSIDSSTGLITVLLTNVDGQARTVNVSMLPSM
ncbi:tail fiber protein [Klebsiella phage VLCpiS10a]|nr:tail fiber protein [Klebsiella phage VLCpiS10a]